MQQTLHTDVNFVIRGLLKITVLSAQSWQQLLNRTGISFLGAHQVGHIARQVQEHCIS